MMKHAKRVDQINLLDRLHRLHGVSDHERARQPVKVAALLGEPYGFRRKIAANIGRAMRHEAFSIGPDAAADLEHPLASPAGELGEPGDVALDKVPACRHFIEVFQRAWLLGGMPDIAWAFVPIIGDLLHGRHAALACSASAFALWYLASEAGVNSSARVS